MQWLQWMQRLCRLSLPGLLRQLQGTIIQNRENEGFLPFVFLLQKIGWKFRRGCVILFVIARRRINMNYATIKNCDIANGPGVRVSLFVSGCTHRCPGCFNEVAWDFDYGQPFTEETVDSILDMLRPSYIRGLTLLGGEPFEPRNQADVVKLLRRVREELPEKSIWAFSGYLFEKDMLSGRIGDLSEYLSCLDVLVDGPFIQAKKNLSLRFRGSENQRIIDMKASLKEGRTILWDDDQKGMREHGAYSR